MPAIVTVTDNSGGFQGPVDLIARNLVAAFDQWAAVLAPSNANIEIALTLANLGEPNGPIAFGGAGVLLSAPGFGGGVLESVAAAELRTGVDQNGAQPDITITLYVDRPQFLGINPLDGSPPSRTTTDLVSVFAHEIGHGLGFASLRDDTTFALQPSGFRTPYDVYFTVMDGNAFFTGPRATALMGGAIPLTSGNVSHVGNAGFNGLLGDDLMAPTLHVGATAISALDVAMLSDMGLATILNDTLTGGSGADTINGGAGDDTVFARAGDDRIDGGEGRSYLRGDEGNDSIVGGAAFDDINGNMGNDTVATGAGDDFCVGGQNNDSLTGGAGFDLVYGNLGADTCEGGEGNDIVRGGQGNDLCLGGAGADYLSGDRDSDTMTGGAGADIFHSFGEAGLDRVTDFNLAEGDRVMLDPGTQYTVSQSGADTVVLMTGGGQMVLVGVQMSTLTTGWIFVG